ncbi:BlaI/MecI/CopY family transcriptional regulator [Dactylosporangium aurantiacum]|uniref:BlaI/MecI/CopY family transcriptional regulator n=1 Tax=Dactylosporangium aurantiacum TaxID=35754 RepID=A0A9Q9INU1_9ACTN|nr:BlaI/MecI/CopY family transcriptional regulator [Dactylosporangium aurantiacum]
MAVLWAADGPLTPAQVRAALAGRRDGAGLAYNTVLTTLTRMHGKGLLLRRPPRRPRAGRSGWRCRAGRRRAPAAPRPGPRRRAPGPDPRSRPCRGPRRRRPPGRRAHPAGAGR